MRAVWNGAVIAESEDTVWMEGNDYFPLESVDPDLVRESPTTSVCPWKGQASYFDVVVDGKVNKDAAWTYREPYPDAQEIKDRVAFWRGVVVERN